VRPADHAHHAAELADGLQLLGGADDGPGQQVVVAAEVLGAGVEHVVHAPLQRPDVVRSGQRGVDERIDPVLLAQRGEPLQIDDAQVGIGGRFADQEPGARMDGRFHAVVIAGRDLVRDDAELAQMLDAELARAMVALVEQDDLIARLQLRQQQTSHGRHAAGIQQGRFTPLQRGELALDHLLARIAVAGVFFAGQLLFHEIDDRLRVGEGVGGRAEDRVGNGEAGLEPVLARVNGLGRKPPSRPVGPRISRVVRHASHSLCQGNKKSRVTVVAACSVRVGSPAVLKGPTRAMAL